MLGITGLVGSGRTELMRAIFGADPSHAESQVFLNGQRIRTHSPRDGVGTRMGFLTEDRKRNGVILPMSIRKNSTLPNMRPVANRLGFINQRTERSLTDSLIEQL
ncbi:MAG: rbsA, partial [Spirosoma sp.]|nr:rbsA [Spirosoma sp.]